MTTFEYRTPAKVDYRALARKKEPPKLIWIAPKTWRLEHGRTLSHSTGPFRVLVTDEPDHWQGFYIYIKDGEPQQNGVPTIWFKSLFVDVTEVILRNNHLETDPIDPSTLPKPAGVVTVNGLAVNGYNQAELARALIAKQKAAKGL